MDPPASQLRNESKRSAIMLRDFMKIANDWIIRRMNKLFMAKNRFIDGSISWWWQRYDDTEYFPIGLLISVARKAF